MCHNMDKQNILEELQNIFVDVFDSEDLRINLETNASDIEGWDSLAHINLIAAIQEEYDIRFSMDDVTSMKSVNDMIEVIMRKRHE